MAEKDYSSSWKSSRRPRKQRKLLYNAPLHLRQKLVHAHLSEPLRNKLGSRSLGIRKGDTVKIMRGQHKKRTGKVESVSLKRLKIYITGIEATKRDGTKALVAFTPSNLMITDLGSEDKSRKKVISRKPKRSKKQAASEPNKKGQ